MRYELVEMGDGADAAAYIRGEIQVRPPTLLEVATAIAHHDGRLPSMAVTRACREEVQLLE